MIGTLAELPPCNRVMNYISRKIITKYFPPAKVNSIVRDLEGVCRNL
jgi:hypothetical protein